MARVRDMQPPLPTAEAARENLKRLSQRIHQRRTRTRETILYDLHQGVKSVEAQVHKQVDMVLSRLKDAPGSKYAFALTHTFLTQLPQALSNTILPSAISAVADTVAGRTTNSLTTLRGRAGLDEFDEEEEEDDDDEDEFDDLDGMEDLSYHQQMALLRLHQQQQDLRLSQQLSSEFGTIALAPSSPSSSAAGSGSESSSPTSSSLGRPDEKDTISNTDGYNQGPVLISSAGASELLAASSHHNYTIAASQVLNAALPSFIPSMVAPIVCVFSYPTPPASKTNTPIHSSPSSPSSPNLASTVANNDAGPGRILTITQQSQQQRQQHRPEGYDSGLQAAIKTDPGIAEVTRSAWTTAEREALFLAATRFKLRGQWGKIREMMRLHRTDKEIEDEYQRLYGEDDDDVDSDHLEDRGMRSDEDLVPIKKESDVEDGDADDEAEPTVFMKFGGHPRSQASTFSDATSSSSSSLLSMPRDAARLMNPVQGSVLMDIQPLPMATSSTSASTVTPAMSFSYRSSLHRHDHQDQDNSQQQQESMQQQQHERQHLQYHRTERHQHQHQHHEYPHPQHHHHQHRQQNDLLLKTLNEKPLRVVKKEFMIDKRFTLEDIPMRL
ncbi:hypothetical protein BGZ51_000157 [Haplosporangium sp. Z 767]|nr:hypothetical protein BGZ50_007755 [Haplosporangium sp. Z 11]KAF9189048.1 hypothetical protein BGZ51_000157 [Haplosporangium sp. Z 767]